jgi:ring-1,2-phenylacetyl-CoA epoxidase subunit PaaE
MTVTIRVPRRRRPVFHPLAVVAVDRLTEDSVAVTFAVPEELREAFAFSPGQHLTVRRVNDAGEVRRSYSICSTPGVAQERGLVRIGVREVAGGAFSTFARTDLRVGDTVEVLPPLGHFTTTVDPTRTRHYGAIAAGSGITPVLSLVATTLSVEPASTFTLLYGNRRASTVMFGEELADLKDRYPDRLHLIHVLSREPQLSPLLSGRIDATRIRAILDSPLLDPCTIDEWFLCGPFGMVTEVRAVLAERGVAGRAVHTELFHVEAEPLPPKANASPAAAGGADDITNSAELIDVTMRLDGRESSFTMRRDERVLDAALRVRAELPYACKGGVCSTCRAKVVAGEVVMARNYALEPDEIDGGYVLTCQSNPVTDRLVIDYDA